MKKLYLSLMIIAPLLLGCSPVPDKYKNDFIFNFDNAIENNEQFDITTDRLINLIDNSFVNVFFYSSTCTPCLDAINMVERYEKETDILLYHYDVNNANYNLLLNKYDFLDSNINYPSIMLLEKGEFKYEINEDKFSSYSNFKKIIDSHLLNKNLYILTKEESLNSYLNEYETSLVFVYDSSNSDQLVFFDEHLRNSLNKNNKNILLLDRNYCETVLFSSLFNYFNIEENITNFIGYYDQEIKRFADYMINDKSLENVLNLFFDSRENL